ncbi:MAG: hypothetical protein FJY92_09650, partial [Candidatus Hydrogenedentes bacterium]|nr:hypothetical protein [Candidatus Hydrogenedentota bacterium]
AAAVLRDDAKGADSVRARTARGLRHVLIDEFQDTDGVQYEIARLLADAPDGPDLFIVGDAKQSIYYFRGAEVDVFDRARNDAGAPLPMRGNFRTAPPVLRFVNSFFAESDLLAAVQAPFQPLEVKRAAAVASRIEFLVPQSREGKTKLEEYREDEARMIAAGLAVVRDESLAVVDQTTGQPRPARYGDIAILLRSLSNVHLYERALREAGIPYSVVQGKGFYERQEVSDLRNLLAVLADPCDEMALTAFLRGPIVAMSDDALVSLAGGIGGPRGVLAGFVSDTGIADAEQQRRLARARKLVAALSEHVERPLDELLHRVFDETGIEGIVLRQFMGLQRVGNLRKTTLLARTFSGARAPGLRAFVRYLDDMAVREVREGEAAANMDDRHNVTIMTVHKAKGLEFPIVYVADIARKHKTSGGSAVIVHKELGFAAKTVGNDGELVAPAMYESIAAARNDEELAEEARVLYVALTRARDHLFVCGAPLCGTDTPWMTAFNEQYGVCAARNGDTIAGVEWEAVVRRDVPAAGVSREMPATRDTLDIDRVWQRLSHVTTIAPRPAAVAATEIAKTICAAPTEQHARTPRPYVPGANSRTRGTLIHAFLERWDYRAAPAGAIDCVMHGAALDGAEADALRADMERIAARLTSCELGA